MSFLSNAYTRTLWCDVCCNFTYHEIVHLGLDEERDVILFARYCEHKLKDAKPFDKVASTVEEVNKPDWNNLLNDNIPFNQTN